MFVITDVCLCEYTSTGQCGVLTSRKGKGRSRPGRQAGKTASPAGHDINIDNDATLELLARTAISHVRAGADMVAPSAMMDGQVRAIRDGLDQAGFAQTPIMSYAVKFASSLYGPFRQAAKCAPKFGDRRSYQMDPLSPRQASLEAQLDADEGADVLMVKPAATYLDVIATIRQKTDLPLAGYHVSGEYSMIKAAAAAGWVDEQAVVLEVTSAIKRAGADLIITYFAEALAGWL
jgi:porphobilinogen synthase